MLSVDQVLSLLIGCPLKRAAVFQHSLNLWSNSHNVACQESDVLFWVGMWRCLWRLWKGRLFQSDLHHRIWWTSDVSSRGRVRVLHAGPAKRMCFSILKKRSFYFHPEKNLYQSTTWREVMAWNCLVFLWPPWRKSFYESVATIPKRTWRQMSDFNRRGMDGIIVRLAWGMGRMVDEELRLKV